MHASGHAPRRPQLQLSPVASRLLLLLQLLQHLHLPPRPNPSLTWPQAQCLALYRLLSHSMRTHR